MRTRPPMHPTNVHNQRFCGSLNRDFCVLNEDARPALVAPGSKPSILVIKDSKSCRCFAILASLAAAGHSGAMVTNAGLLPIAGDIGHLIASALWPGGLVPLLVLLVSQYRTTDQTTRVFVVDVVRRFSSLSLMVVGLLAGTGLLNSYFIVGSWGALFATDYGRWLLLKIALFLLMLGFGALNLLVLKPQLARAALVQTQTPGAVMTPMSSLIRSVTCETFLARSHSVRILTSEKAGR